MRSMRRSMWRAYMRFLRRRSRRINRSWRNSWLGSVMCYFCMALSSPALEWPSLTVQWFPTHDQSLHKILLGTYSSGDNPNYLSITQVHLPPEDAEAELVNGDDSQINIESNKIYSFLLRQFSLWFITWSSYGSCCRLFGNGVSLGCLQYLASQYF